ncbi:MAG: c-type cytochrome [Rhodospirillaceae bacterium]|jgi:cytochrome c|nr:c-type cytochrome [Rhodospirillaceae bacterium]
MSEKPSPDKFKSNSAMMAGFAAIWLTVGANEVSHFLVPEDEDVETFGYEIEIPEGFGAGVGGEVVDEGIVDVKPLLAAASIADGAKVARKCQSCHTFAAGERNGTGPNLHNIVGSNLASRDRGDFKLSDSILAGADVWTYDALNAYLEDPKSVAPKGTMSFIGLRKPKDRASIIKFLMSKTDSPPEVVLDAVEAVTEEIAAVAEGVMDAAGDATLSVGVP